MQFEPACNYILNKLKEDLPVYLHYHNVEHTMDVYDACKRLAKQEKINTSDTKLLLTAACYHDSGFLTHVEGHEIISCQIASEALSNYCYTINDIAQICGMIMATRIPQSPTNHLEEILADADLDYLGREDFFLISNKLYLEMFALGSVNSVESWDKVQVNFFENHHYFTKTSKQLRQLNKDKHLKQLKAKVKKFIP